MQSILDELYYERAESGKVMKGNKDYERLIKEAHEIYEELGKDGTKERIAILDRLWLASVGQESEASCSYFKEGFKTCLMILAEIFVK